MNRTMLGFVPVFALALGCASCDDFDMDFGGDGGGRVEAPFHYAYDVHPGAHLDLETFNGAVEIRSWDQNKVDISGVKYARTAALRDAIKIDSRATDEGVAVRVVRPAEHHGNMGAKFVVRVPQEIVLNRIVSSNGAIRVENTSGSARVQTSNGAINMSQIRGAVNAETSNGGIDLSDVTGNANLNSSNGHIHAEHMHGAVEASSSNGNITVALDEPPKGEIHASTSNSSIEVSMPASSAARVRADTSNGSISSDFEVKMQGTASKTHLEGAVNGGGPLLDLSTSNGSIKLVKP